MNMNNICKWQTLPPGTSGGSYISYLERTDPDADRQNVLIFLHSPQESASVWCNLMEKLSADYRCIAPNLPGGSQMDMLDGHWQEYANSTAGLIAELEISGVILVLRDDSCAAAVGIIQAAAGRFKVAGVINITENPVFISCGSVKVLFLSSKLPDDFTAEDGYDVRICDTSSPEAVADAVKNAAENIFSAGMTCTAVNKTGTRKNMQLRRLFDSVGPGAVLIIFILRMLQMIRRLQGSFARPGGGGWRKLTRVFLGSEYSKFMLGCFRLAYAPPWGIPADKRSASALLVGRFAEFLMRNPELHWHVVPGRFSFALKRSFFCDVVEVHTDALGHITGLKPHFDYRHPEWLELKREQLDIAVAKIISTYNRFRKLPSSLRPQRIAAELRKWLRKGRGLNRSERKNMQQVVERIMAAAVIFCEHKSDDRPEHNMAMPDMKRYRHPGWGMLSVVARFSPDFTEADLWCQFNHVTADGAPMQEALLRLKQSWGCAGTTLYPALQSTVSRAESVYCGDGIFRSRVFADFTALLKLRKNLNGFYNRQTNISLAALVLWGMSRHPYFREKKILLPVDVRHASSQGDDLDIMVIRPGSFRNSDSETGDFLRFNMEFNRRLEDIRNGVSESGEFLELCAMLHPLLYRLAGIVMRKNLQEIVGTVGLSILRDAEMFVSPLTDFQRNGFMTIGAVSMNTENNRKAGAVSICGTREQIRYFLEALKELFTEFPDRMNREITEKIKVG